ncbi:MAG: hypothetical protein M0D57_00515 [Sphingobacteriales bacterium JAD_PAG50586_3]|nr:MAG: hypothetical protein M0D57_00515 [Sphingobacteriales bacterium JAD_PAG50586_3]
MKHFLLSLFILFTFSVSAQTPSVKRFADLVNMHNIDSVTAYIGKLGYVKGTEIPQIGNMYEFAVTSFAKKDTSVVKSSISYSSGHHYAMNQGPLSVSLNYSTSSAAEFDTLVAEIKTLGAEKITKEANTNVSQYKLGEYIVSTFYNPIDKGSKYTISLSANLW